MPDSGASQVTQILRQAAAGDRAAAESLLPVVYDELRAMARAHLARHGAHHTLQPTALVHEAYLRLVGSADPGWNGRAHFFGAAAMAMRQILVDAARARSAAKRGGGRKRVVLDDVGLTTEMPADELLALDEALEELRQYDARKSQVVMLRYYAGLTNEQVAELLGVSTPTIEREWRFARSFLHARVASPSPDGAGAE